jgi:hypothetical protein
LAAREHLWILATQPLRKSQLPWARRVTLWAYKHWHVANQQRSAWQLEHFCARHRLPQAGWTQRCGMDSWGQQAPITARQAEVINLMFSSHQTPWSEPNTEQDLLCVLRAKARHLAGDPISSIGGSWALSRIPPTRPDLAVFLRRELATLDPDWHKRDLHSDPMMQRLSQAGDWQDEVRHARQSQEAFLESEIISGAFACRSEEKSANEARSTPAASPSSLRPRL